MQLEYTIKDSTQYTTQGGCALPIVAGGEIQITLFAPLARHSLQTQF